MPPLATFIILEVFFIWFTAEAIGAAEHDLANGFLDRPFVGHNPRRQVIKEHGVIRALAGLAKVVDEGEEVVEVDGAATVEVEFGSIALGGLAEEVDELEEVVEVDDAVAVEVAGQRWVSGHGDRQIDADGVGHRALEQDVLNADRGIRPR